MSAPHNSQASANVSTTARTAVTACPSKGSARGRTGTDGAAPRIPSHPSTYASRAQLKNGRAQLSVHRLQRPTGMPPAAQASEPVRGGDERRQQQRDHEQTQRPRRHRLALQEQTRLHRAGDVGGRVEGIDGAQHRAPEAFQAFHAHSIPRRALSGERAVAVAGGPSSPDTWTSTAGRPPALSTPCSPTASGKARCVSCPSALGEPGSMPVSWVIASATVRWSCSGAEPSPSENEATSGRRVCAPARSPRTIAASSGPPAVPSVAALPSSEGLDDELLRARVAAAAPARRGQDDRALGLARGEHACQLQQRRRRRQLRLRPPCRGVAMREDQDRRGAGRARTLARRSCSACAPRRSSGRRSCNGVHRETPAGGAPEPFERPRHMRRELLIAATAGAPIREACGQALQFGKRRRTFERFGGERRAESSRAGAQRERGDRQREQERHEGRSIQAPVEHA